MTRRPNKAERARRLVSEGAQLLADKRPGDAIARLTEAHALDPQDVAILINLGGAYVMQGNPDAAIPVLEEAVQLEPHNVMVWTNLAAAYLGVLHLSSPERQDKAISAYEQVLALDKNAPHINYNLALIYLQREELAQARSQFLAALEVDPGDRDARYYLDKLDTLQRGRESGSPAQKPA
jgi:cytochrome c-type biogenesis protein CcmH/NrfG